YCILRDRIDCRPAIGLTKLNADISSQMLVQLDEGLNVPLRPGGEYHVQLEYRTLNDAEGMLYVRNPLDGEYPAVASTHLDRTDGQWRTVGTAFRRPTTGKIDLCINNTAVGEGNSLYFRAVALLEGAR